MEPVVAPARDEGVVEGEERSKVGPIVRVEIGGVRALRDHDGARCGRLRGGLPGPSRAYGGAPDQEPGPPQEGPAREGRGLAHRRAR